MFVFGDDDMDLISIGGSDSDDDFEFEDPNGPAAFMKNLELDSGTPGGAQPAQDSAPGGAPMFDLGAISAQAESSAPSASMLDFSTGVTSASSDGLFEPGKTPADPGTMTPVRLGSHSALFYGDALCECQQCQRPFKAHEEVVRCPRCQAITHLDCWNHIGGCPSVGCDLSPRSASMTPMPEIGTTRDEQPGDFDVAPATVDLIEPMGSDMQSEPGVTFVPGASSSDPGTLIPVILGPSTPLVTSDDARCLVCGDGFVGGAKVVKCPSCLVFTHADCWSGNEGCPQQRCDMEPPAPGTQRERALPRLGQARKAGPADFAATEGGIEPPSAGEVTPIRLGAASPLIGVQCLIARVPFAAGDEIIICPECRTGARLTAWQSNEGCGQEDCALAPPTAGARRTVGLPSVMVARDEELSDYPGAAASDADGAPAVIQSVRILRSSPLVQDDDAVCPSCNKPYKDNRLVVKCPGCGDPIHQFCWVRYSGCKKHGCSMCSREHGGALAGPLPLLNGWREERVPQDFGVIHSRKSLGEPVIVQQHEAPVSAVSTSADGAVVASADIGGTIQIRRLDNPQPVEIAPHGAAGVTALALSPSGDLLASAGADSRVHLHATDTGAHVATLTEQVPWGVSAAFSPDGQLLAVCGCSNKALVWKVDTQQLVAELPQYAWARTVAFDSGSQRLARASRHGSDISLSEVVSGSSDQGFISPSGEVRAMSFSSDGAWLAAGCTDNHLRLWDVATRVRRDDMESDTSEAVAFVGGAATLGSVGRGGLSVWQPSKDGLMLHDTYTDAHAMTAIAAAAQCSRLVAGCANGSVMVFDVLEEMDEGGV